MKNRILQVFFDVDLRNGHEGLREIAKKAKVDVENLKEGEFLIFLNTRKDKVKVYASNDVYAYYRSPTGRIQLEAIRHIPNAFNGTSINMEKALTAVFAEKGIGV